jgi:hypothetical protein
MDKIIGLDMIAISVLAWIKSCIISLARRQRKEYIMKLSLGTLVFVSLLGACEPGTDGSEQTHKRSKAAATGKALVFHSETVPTLCDRGMYAEACHLIDQGR